MTHWNNGYRTDVLYTYGYYKELSPNFQRFIALLLGYQLAPASETDVHLELGIGQGVSFNINAASNPGKFIGNDFNPSHITFAEQLARASGANTELSDASFEEMSKRTDLPQCNSISLHGIWSWINDENRQYIVDIIQRCLKPGGVVYMGYNCSAGRIAFAPWRDMMYQYFESQSGNTTQRLQLTIDYFKPIFEKNPNLLEQNWILKSNWDRICNNDPHYVLHEYFNQNWDSHSLMELAQTLSSAKLEFIGHTDVSNITNPLSLNQMSYEQVKAIPTILEAEQLRDMLMNQTFRKDLFVKGGIHLNQATMEQQLQNYQFVLTVPEEKFENSLYGGQDKREFNNDLFSAIKTTLVSDNYRPKSFAELQEAVNKQAVNSKYETVHLLQVLLLKMYNGNIQPCQKEYSDQISASCLSLNQAILQQLNHKLGDLYFASPVTGSGVQSTFLQSLCMYTWLHDVNASDSKICENIWQLLQHHRQILIDNQGNKLNTKEENIAWIKSKLTQERLQIPVWQALGILPKKN